MLTPLVCPQLDIVTYAVNADTATEASRRAQATFEAAAQHGLHLALIELPVGFVRRYAPHIGADATHVRCLRSVLMKPEHEDWIPEITARLEECAAA